MIYILSVLSIILIILLIIFANLIKELRFLIDKFININQKFYESQIKSHNSFKQNLMTFNNIFIEYKNLIKDVEKIKGEFNLIINENKPYKLNMKQLNPYKLNLDEINKKLIYVIDKKVKKDV
jgi:competence protein ComGC